MTARRGLIATLVGAQALACSGCPSSLEPAAIERRKENADRQAGWRDSDVALCERLLPSATRERFLPGLTLTAAEKVVAGAVTCEVLPAGATGESLILGSSPGARISYLCSAGITSAAQMDEVVPTRTGATPIAGLGRRALGWGTGQIEFWHASADCNVDILWHLDPAQTLPFAHEVDRLLTPALGQSILTSPQP